MEKMFILEKLVDDKWWFVGTYTSKFIQPLCAAVENLVRNGFTMYDTIRVRVEDGS